MPTPNQGLGRPKGALNHATRELKEFWHRFFTSVEYRESAKKRILDGSSPHLEKYLLERLYGKPKETVDLRVGVPDDEDLSTLSAEVLLRRFDEARQQLLEAAAVEAAIPAEFRRVDSP